MHELEVDALYIHLDPDPDQPFGPSSSDSPAWPVDVDFVDGVVAAIHDGDNIEVDAESWCAWVGGDDGYDGYVEETEDGFVIRIYGAPVPRREPETGHMDEWSANALGF